MPAALMALGVLVLAATWSGPLPGLSRQSFSAHMAMHMLVVAVGAPLLAFGIAGTALDPARKHTRLIAPVQASIVELGVVWAWHLPRLHELARSESVALAVEQASFLAAALWLWIAAVGGKTAHREHLARSGAGVFGLLFTSMHMTLLGALLALSPRLLYPHVHGSPDTVSALADQHWGGAIMLLAGSASYLIGALVLTLGLLRQPASVSGGARPRGLLR